MNLKSKTDRIENALLEQSYEKDDHGIWISGNRGYWSNLTKSENTDLLSRLDKTNTRDAILKTHPTYENIIFSEKRNAGLELLEIQPGDICIDYGCMWGALTIGMANRGGIVLSIDQTYESLVFLEHRVTEMNLDNVVIAQNDVRRAEFPKLADYAVVNGVLEWIPETGEIDLQNYYGKAVRRERTSENPEKLQYNFLKLVHNSLKVDGTMFLSIENRYDYTQFFGKKDPHSNLLFTSFLPRAISNKISLAALKRPYVNYLYSFKALKNLIVDVGFHDIELYMAFPDYRFPELVLPYARKNVSKYINYGMDGYSWKRISATLVERFLMKKLRARFFAPSIMVVAKA